MSKEITDSVKEVLTDNDVHFMLNDEVKQIEGKNITFKSGETKQFDMVVTALGLTPNSEFIGEAIQLNDKGYIKVNKYFETSDESIYALGDAIETFYRHIDQPATIALAWGTHRAASIIAHNITQKEKIAFKGLLGSNILKLFNFTYASTGLPESILEKMDHVTKVTQTQKHKAGYMPGSSKLSLVVYYDNKSRQILSASASGQHGVDKRIDIISTAMIGGLTIDDLTDIEVAYHPDYSSPKDIVNMIGYKAK